MEHIDVSYDKNRLGFVKIVSLDGQIVTQQDENPKFNLYYENQIKNGRLIVESREKMQVQSVPLNQYRNPSQLFGRYPQSARYGYLNIHNVSPFKPRELTDKYIIENGLVFAAPTRYFEIFYHINFNCQDAGLDPSNQCEIHVQVYSTNQGITQLIETADFSTFGMGMSEGIQSVAAKFLELVDKFSQESVVFLLGLKMNLGRKCPLLKLLQLGHYNPQYSEKRRKQSNNFQDSVIKQVTNVYELRNCYFLDITSELPNRDFNQDFRDAINQYQQSGFLEIKLKQLQYLQIPLNYVLYESIASNIHTFILRCYFQAGFAFVYNNSKVELTREKLIGGLYNQAEVQYQRTILENIAEGDFFSLYGTIIIARNVSYETDHCLQSQDPLAACQNKIGVIPSMLKQFFDLRMNMSLECKIERQALKMILVNTYGLFGSEFYSIYNPTCSNYIVEVGRQACEIAKSQLLSLGIADLVLQQQTDSCLFKPKIDPKDTSFTHKWTELNLAINRELGSSNNLFLFKFETDKYAKKMIIPKAKNTLISLVQCGDAEVVKMKGDLYSEQQSEYRNSVIQEYFRLLLTQPELQIEGLKLSERMNCVCIDPSATDHSASTCYFKLYQREKLRLESLISEMKVSQIVKDYSIFVKFSSEESRSVYMQRQYGISSSCRCLFFGDRILPTHLLTPENVGQLRVAETITNMLRPVKSVLGGESQNTNENNNIYRKGFMERIITYAKINDMTQLDPPKEDQCMLRVESRGSKVFINYYFDEIKDLVLENPLKSFHEILSREINKMYFDIDSKSQINEALLHKALLHVLAKLLPVKIEPKIHKCTAFSESDNPSKEKKFSHHIVVDIKCTKQLNRFVALQIDNRYQFLTQTSNKIFDMGVYNSDRQSLRLPMCYKITKDEQLDKRPFLIQSNSEFEDFIIGNTRHCAIEFSKLIHFDKDYPVDPSRFCEKLKGLDVSDQDILLNIAAKIGVPRQFWTIEQKRVHCQKPFRCIVCDRIHSSDNLKLEQYDNKLYVNCFSNRHRQENKNMPVLLFDSTVSQPKAKQTTYEKIKTIYDEVNESRIFESLATQRQELRYVQFELHKNTTYVISDMGTGKSQQIKRYLDSVNADFKVLCLSFRRTFAIEFASKYGLQNYMVIKGRLNSAVHKRLILQIDSLTRYDLNTIPDVLIVDEIESILERIQNCKENQEISIKVLKLIESSKNVVFMDGLIEKKTIECLNRFRNCQDPDVVLNTYSPRQNYKYVIIPYNQYMGLQVINYLVRLLQRNKKVYGMVTSKRLGFFLKEEIERQCKDKKVIFYHGSDARMQEDINPNNPSEISNSSHSTVKQKHFKDVNQYWKCYDLVLHNSAVTAGVSFDQEYFDLQVNVYSSGTTTPLSFFQGCHRVRHLKDQQVVTFLEHSKESSSNKTPSCIFEKEQHIEGKLGINADYNFSKLKQLQLLLHAREECAKVFQTHILCKYLKRMKYQVTIFDEKQTLDDNLRDKGFNEQQRQNIADNQEISHQKIDLDAGDFKHIAEIKLTEQDQQLYDSEYRDMQIGILNSNLPYYKVTKLDIKKEYNMTFEQINDPRLTEKHFKLLYNNLTIQRLRKLVQFQITNNADPTKHTEYLKGGIDRFRMLRNNNMHSETASSMTMGLVKTALDIIDYYEHHEYEQLKALAHISTMKNKLTDCSVTNNLSYKNVSSIQTILKHFNFFFNILMTHVTYNNDKLVFEPILKPIHEHLCFPKAKTNFSSLANLEQSDTQTHSMRKRCKSDEVESLEELNNN